MNQARPATREKWRQIIGSQRASGKTAVAWCREHRVTQASFFAWKRRLKSAVPDFGELSRGAAEFVEVHAAQDCERADAAVDTSASIEVCCHGGRRLLLRRGFDQALLIRAIQVLEGLPFELEGLA